MASSQEIGNIVEAAFRASSTFRDDFRDDPSKNKTKNTRAAKASIDAIGGFSTWSKNPGFAGQIKSVQNRSRALSTVDGFVGLASALALSKYSGGLELDLCVWEQASPSTKTVRSYCRMLFPPLAWKALLGSIPFETIEAFDREVKKKPPKDATPEQFKALTDLLHRKARLLTQLHDATASLNVKIDSRGTRRLQCSCSMSDLAKTASDVEWIQPGQFDAFGLPSQLQSGPRVRLTPEQKLMRRHAPQAKASDLAALPAHERPLGARGTLRRINVQLSAYRKANLRALLSSRTRRESTNGLQARGASKRFAATIGIAPAALSNMLNGVKSCGRKMARSIEAALGLDSESLDIEDRHSLCDSEKTAVPVAETLHTLLPPQLWMG